MNRTKFVNESLNIIKLLHFRAMLLLFSAIRRRLYINSRSFPDDLLRTAGIYLNNLRILRDLQK